MDAVIVIFVIVAVVLYFNNTKAAKRNFVYREFLPAWRIILKENVAFYNSLSEDDKVRFENRMLEFLNEVRITGISVTIDDTDRILTAASAIIPIFGFDGWKYNSIHEVLIYPDAFNERFETSGGERSITGMVGEGAMNGTMILSKNALIQGFINDSDKQNTAIHEFVHLIDKADGAIDGIPELLLQKQYTLPWIKLIAQNIQEINQGKSDINPYGATSQTEFLAVASEYFFEKPALLQKKHPELYEMLEHMFKQDLDTKKLVKQSTKIGRNDPCPCNNGRKFKNCCGSEHFNRNAL